MLDSMTREPVIEAHEADYALPTHTWQQASEDARNPAANGEMFNSQESRQPSVIQRLSQNIENNKRVSAGHFQQGIEQTSHLPSRHSLSQEEAVVPKLTLHSAALICPEVKSAVRVPVMSVSVPIAKGARAARENSMDISSVSRLTRQISGAPVRESLVYSMETFSQPIRESRRHLQKASSAQTSPRKKSRSSKAIQYPDQAGGIKLPFPEGELDSSNFQSSDRSTGRPRIQSSKDRAKTDGSMLMHLCVAINVILFSALSGIVFAYFLHMGTIKRM